MLKGDNDIPIHPFHSPHIKKTQEETSKNSLLGALRVQILFQPNSYAMTVSTFSLIFRIVDRKTENEWMMRMNPVPDSQNAHKMVSSILKLKLHRSAIFHSACNHSETCVQPLHVIQQPYDSSFCLSNVFKY